MTFVNACEPGRARAFAAVLAATAMLAGPHGLRADDIGPAVGELTARYCIDCHDDRRSEGGLDLASLAHALDDRVEFAIWTRVIDRVAAGEMPPPEARRQPDADERARLVEELDRRLLDADTAWREANGRAPLRRLTRSEYEHTLWDLLHIEGAELRQMLPEDGSAHGTSKHADALDLSYVQVRQYLAAANQALDWTIVTFPDPPDNSIRRSHAQKHHSLVHGMYNADAHLITDDRRRDPRVPLSPHDLPKETRQNWLDSDFFDEPRSVGVLRNGDGYDPTLRLGARLPGRYRIRASHWAFYYDKGEIEPARQPEIAVLELKNELGAEPLHYFDAGANGAVVQEFEAWLKPGDRFGWTAVSLWPKRVSEHPGKGTTYEGPGIAVDWFEIEGPLFDQWPPAGHRLLFGDLPLKPLSPESGLNLPPRQRFPGESFLYPELARYPHGNRDDLPLHAVENHRDHGPFTPFTEEPLADAENLLREFLTLAYRRPVDDREVDGLLGLVAARLEDGDSFELAMRQGYSAALTSTPFLYRMETPGPLDDHALAARLSYFLWNSLPDAELLELADNGGLAQPDTIRAQARRLMEHPRFDRFIAEFLDHWLALDQIEATTPDRRLYPEFRPFMADMMVMETRAYFRELMLGNRPVWEVIDSDWGMLNQAVAELYGVEGVEGHQPRRVELPADSPRGGILTQPALLKVTADGTSTSPVLRGVFILERLLGIHPSPPPPDISGVEPDVQGAVTIRELLARHSEMASCAACHRQIDPPGFALEEFDPIGQWREHYRATEVGEPAALTYPNGQRSAWRHGREVESDGVSEEGIEFAGINDFRQALRQAGHEDTVARNLMDRMITYATGAEVSYGDRAERDVMLAKWRGQGYGLGDLVEIVVASSLFREK